MTGRRETPRQVRHGLVREPVEGIEVETRGGGAQVELVQFAFGSSLGCRMQSRGPYPRALEQPPALGTRRLDNGLSFTLCRGDHSSRVLFRGEYPVDGPCNGCVGAWWSMRPPVCPANIRATPPGVIRRTPYEINGKGGFPRPAGRRRSAGLSRPGLHHQAGAATRNVRDDRRAPVELGDGAEADGERELDRLAAAQPEVAGLDEHALALKLLARHRRRRDPGSST